MKFLQNKYSRIYYQLIDRAKSRTLTTYTEKHHIIPKSLGGSNETGNIVKLTAREHFICHMLLIKMTEGKDRTKMCFALKCVSEMCGHTTNSRTFERLRMMHSHNVRTYLSGYKHTEKTKENMRKSALTKSKPTNETRRKMSESHKGKLGTMTGKHHSENTKKLLSVHNQGENNPMFGRTHSDESKDKIRKTNLGRKHSQEMKDKCREILINKTMTCNKCNKTMSVPLFHRYHKNC